MFLLQSLVWAVVGSVIPLNQLVHQPKPHPSPSQSPMEPTPLLGADTMMTRVPQAGLSLCICSTGSGQILLLSVKGSLDQRVSVVSRWASLIFSCLRLIVHSSYDFIIQVAKIFILSYIFITHFCWDINVYYIMINILYDQIFVIPIWRFLPQMSTEWSLIPIAPGGSAISQCPICWNLAVGPGHSLLIWFKDVTMSMSGKLLRYILHHNPLIFHTKYKV